MSGFKKFLLQGNLVDIAVAFIIATSFAAVVKTFTDVITSFISRIVGGTPNFDSWQVWKDDTGVGIPLGSFLTALIAFVILAAVVYFLVVVPYLKAKERFFPDPVEETPVTEIDLLTQIRDTLAARP
ncbi:MAG TPA: MscL family protein [Nocardioides sp.]|nr:MscL family protein [Nocardioides sp.]